MVVSMKAAEGCEGIVVGKETKRAMLDLVRRKELIIGAAQMNRPKLTPPKI